MSISRRWHERRERVAREEAGKEAGEPIGEPRRAAIGAEEAEAADAPSERTVELAEHRVAAEAVDLDTLGPEADMSVFLREGVPAVLRRQAFRALWRSSPMFGDFERLNDYDEDFRNPKLVMQTFQSAWQAGRGYLEKTTDAKNGDVASDDHVGERAVEAPEAEEPPSTTRAIAEDVTATASSVVDSGSSVEREIASEDEAATIPVPSLRARLGL